MGLAFVVLALAALTNSRSQDPSETAVVGPQLQVWDGERFATVLDCFDGTPAVVPLSTTVDQVTRAVVTARGVRARVLGAAVDPGAWSARWIEHPTDQRVLLIGGEPYLTGPPVLPRSVESRSTPGLELPSLLPWFARQDGQGQSGAGLTFDTSNARDLETIVIPLRSSPSLPKTFACSSAQLNDTTPPANLPIEEYPLDPGYSSALIPDDAWGQRWALDSTTAIDAVYRARVERLDPSRLEAVAIGESDIEGEVSIRPPALESGTGTLLIRVDPARVSPVDGAGASRAEAPTGPGGGAFEDVARQVGADLMHLEGPHEQLDIRPTMGPGAAWADIEGDGDPDLYLVQGGGRAGSASIGNRLALNLGDRGFANVSRSAGVDDTGWGMAAQFVDLDGDGALDLYVANYGEDVLYRRVGSEGEVPTFANVTAAAGVAGNRWGGGIAAADPDHDGDLDVYVTSYLVYDEALMPPLEDLPLSREDPIEMLPFAFPGDRNVFYRNESERGSIRLVDATDELELADLEGRGMQPVFFDYDQNGTQDLYVANDVSLNRLYRVDDEGLFTDIAFQTGMDDPRGGMGVTIGDVDGDLDEDLFLTNWELEPNALYRNNVRSHTSQRRRVASFRDVTVHAGFGTHGVGFTSWGCELFDLELDGDLDLFVANGYTSPDYETTGICVGQPNHLYLNDGEGRFRLATELAGPDVARRHASRCVAACDWDRDGDVDLLVTANNGPTQLLENRAERPAGAQWLGLELRMQGANPFAIGAFVTVEVDGRSFVRSLRAGTSYLAGNPPELHFGLGPVEGPAQVTIDWPDGQTTEHTLETLSRWVTIER